LVIINDDTYEELVTFKLSRLSVYVAFSTAFVLLVTLTVALIVFTPLKYYIPGYGSKESRTELQLPQMKTDSLERSIQYKDQYVESLKKVLSSSMPVQKDTTSLTIPKTDIIKQ
jgi:predicted PurR-regulated permease PerM